jgi:hypothetical protein
MLVDHHDIRNLISKRTWRANSEFPLAPFHAGEAQHLDPSLRVDAFRDDVMFVFGFGGRCVARKGCGQGREVTGMRRMGGRARRGWVAAGAPCMRAYVRIRTYMSRNWYIMFGP